MIIQRPYWHQLIHQAWQQRSIIWLMGIRRVGKTSLCRSIENIIYFDCENPRTRQQMIDPQAFLDHHRQQIIALDEIHRLDNPSELLKIAADYYPDIKIIATGSSTLGTTAKFKDTLTGRKTQIWLTPLRLNEGALFGNPNLEHRFLFGGLPPFFAQQTSSDTPFHEWVDGYWAKDIEDIFSVGKRQSFQKFTELLLANSGGLFEASRYTVPCEISRTTVAHYLHVLSETFVVHIVKPFSSHKATEIISAPKVYGFDTGFVTFFKGRGELRNEDLGYMWEHCVLNDLYAHLQRRSVNYWRDKSDHEIDFVLYNRSDESATAIECKYSVPNDEGALKKIARNIAAFRYNYPKGKNFIVVHTIDSSFVRRINDIECIFVSIQTLIEHIPHNVPWGEPLVLNKKN